MGEFKERLAALKQQARESSKRRVAARHEAIADAVINLDRCFDLLSGKSVDDCRGRSFHLTDPGRPPTLVCEWLEESRRAAETINAEGLAGLSELQPRSMDHRAEASQLLGWFRRAEQLLTQEQGSPTRVCAPVQVSPKDAPPAANDTFEVHADDGTIFDVEWVDRNTALKEARFSETRLREWGEAGSIAEVRLGQKGTSKRDRRKRRYLLVTPRHRPSCPRLAERVEIETWDIRLPKGGVLWERQKTSTDNAVSADST